MILLVEDNKMNQLVGSKVLESWAIGFAIANNGVEAVSAVQSGSYDADPHGLPDARDGRLRGHGGHPPVRGLGRPHADHRHDRGRHGG